MHGGRAQLKGYFFMFFFFFFEEALESCLEESLTYDPLHTYLLQQLIIYVGEVVSAIYMLTLV